MTEKELCSLVDISEANLSILRSGKAVEVMFHIINRIYRNTLVENSFLG